MREEAANKINLPESRVQVLLEKSYTFSWCARYSLLLACTKLKNKKKVLSRFHSVSLGFLGHMNEIMMMMMMMMINKKNNNNID